MEMEGFSIIELAVRNSQAVICSKPDKAVECKLQWNLQQNPSSEKQEARIELAQRR